MQRGVVRVWGSHKFASQRVSKFLKCKASEHNVVRTGEDCYTRIVEQCWIFEAT